jgi:hypothetical protein
MHNDHLLEKHKYDPSWAEVLHLYSGLFDTQNERENFIIDLAETDILLAAECKTSSVEGENKLEINIVKKAIHFSQDKTNFERAKNAFFALIELRRMNEIIPMLSVERYTNYFKDLLIVAIQKYDLKKIEDFISVIIKSKKQELALFLIISIINEKDKKYRLFNTIILSMRSIFDILKVENEKTIRLSKLSRTLEISRFDLAKAMEVISNQKISANPNLKINTKTFYYALQEYLITNNNIDKSNFIGNKNKSDK